VVSHSDLALTTFEKVVRSPRQAHLVPILSNKLISLINGTIGTAREGNRTDCFSFTEERNAYVSWTSSSLKNGSIRGMDIRQWRK